MPCTVQIKDEKLYIKFNQLSKEVFYEKLEIVKSLYDRQFNSKSKSWMAVINEENIKKLKDAGFEFIEEAEKLLKEDFNKMPERYLPDISSKLDERLYPFQKEGVRFLEGRQGNGMVFDQMGLGKTCQSLSYLKLHPELRPVLIVCPATLKLNWEKEIKIWMSENEKIEILSGRKPNGINPDTKIFIINYDILAEGIEIKVNNKTRKVLVEGGWWEVFRSLNIKVLIADECQMISNIKSIRTKAFIQIKKKINKFIALSGTPIKNRPVEFFPVLSMIDPRNFHNRWSYLQRYCGAKQTHWGWEFKGLTNGKELFRTIYPYMIRREKKNVLKDLPEKTTIIVPLECDKNIYNKYKISYEEVFKKELGNKIEVQNQIELLKQLAYAAKRDFVIKWIKDFLDTGEKLVLFAYHIKVLDDIQKEFPDSVRIDGSVKLEDRQKAIDEFQNGKVQLFIGQIQAAGVGITLTAASSCVFVEFAWVPTDHAQASDRIHRIGQESDAVFIYYLIANGTIENDIVKLLQEKSKMIGQVLDGEEREFFKEDIYEDLVKEIKK